jgi:hypothetical protein
VIWIFSARDVPVDSLEGFWYNVREHCPSWDGFSWYGQPHRLDPTSGLPVNCTRSPFCRLMEYGLLSSPVVLSRYYVRLRDRPPRVLPYERRYVENFRTTWNWFVKWAGRDKVIVPIDGAFNKFNWCAVDPENRGCPPILEGWEEAVLHDWILPLVRDCEVSAIFTCLDEFFEGQALIPTVNGYNWTKWITRIRESLWG